MLYRPKPVDEVPATPARRPARKAAAVRKVVYNPAYKVSSRKAKTEPRPPRTARIRKSGQRSGKKAFQGR